MEITKTSFQFLFANTIRALFKQSAKEFENQGIKITPEQNYLLRILTSQEESIQSDLAEIMQKDKSAIMRHIDQLEKMGYVVRVNDAVDRRKKHIVITELGTDVLNKCEEVISRLSERNMQDISENELEIFKKVLIKLKENAEK
ncbi:MarR family transcriptional regulator [Arcicella sp. DC2W]|uniref:MarR family transcriptional regulator n=1 Tax=Arcicella gelida TaxID=2984195 RepID=A0ABU5S4B8_9BACT|nr:MarR family transcriptional regulator [Arcicella sp. DC2W]MEA5403265.1 MarR family transcriptional regulator [Arcicella sp. DC2W]